MRTHSRRECIQVERVFRGKPQLECSQPSHPSRQFPVRRWMTCTLESAYSGDMGSRRSEATLGCFLPQPECPHEARNGWLNRRVISDKQNSRRNGRAMAIGPMRFQVMGAPITPFAPITVTPWFHCPHHSGIAARITAFSVPIYWIQVPINRNPQSIDRCALGTWRRSPSYPALFRPIRLSHLAGLWQ